MTHMPTTTTYIPKDAFTTIEVRLVNGFWSCFDDTSRRARDELASAPIEERRNLFFDHLQRFRSVWPVRLRPHSRGTGLRGSGGIGNAYNYRHVSRAASDN